MTARRGILLIGNYPPPFGGVPKHLEVLVPYLVQTGWDVHVLSGGSSGTEEGSGFTVYRDPRSKLPRRLATLRFLARATVAGRGAPAFAALRRLPPAVWAAVMTRVSIAARIIESHDIRLISAYNLLSGAPVGAIAAEMYRLPLVVTNLGEIYSHRRLIDRQLPMIRHVTRVATVLTSLTQHCAQSYRELGLSPSVRVLRYGIDWQRFAGMEGNGRIRQRFSFAPDADVVLFIGRMVRDMGVHVLLESLPALLGARPSICVLIAGASGDLRAEVDAAVSRWPGRVASATDIAEDELPHFFRAATLVVAPTLGARACGSLAAAEAMAAGKPVVATRIGGIPEYVSDGETGVLVAPNDAGALTRAVLELLNDRTRLGELGRGGQRRVAELFDSERTNAQLEQVFRETARP